LFNPLAASRLAFTLAFEMNGVEIHDMDPRGFLAFDLREVLACLGEEASCREWTCQGLECAGDGTEDLDEIERESRAISGTRLCDLAGRINQVIWGEFYGRQPHEKNASLIVKAIDSTLWEVFGDEKCLSLVRTRFTSVKPAAYELGWCGHRSVLR
jgi:hypothetical protein